MPRPGSWLSASPSAWWIASNCHHFADADPNGQAHSGARRRSGPNTRGSAPQPGTPDIVLCCARGRTVKEMCSRWGSCALAAAHPIVCPRLYPDRGAKSNHVRFVHALLHNGLRGSTGPVRGGDNAAMERLPSRRCIATLSTDAIFPPGAAAVGDPTWFERSCRQLRASGALTAIEFELVHTYPNRGLIFTPRQSTVVGTVSSLPTRAKRAPATLARNYYMA